MNTTPQPHRQISNLTTSTETHPRPPHFPQPSPRQYRPSATPPKRQCPPPQAPAYRRTPRGAAASSPPAPSTPANSSPPSPTRSSRSPTARACARPATTASAWARALRAGRSSPAPGARQPCTATRRASARTGRRCTRPSARCLRGCGPTRGGTGCRRRRGRWRRCCCCSRRGTRRRGRRLGREGRSRGMWRHFGGRRRFGGIMNCRRWRRWCMVACLSRRRCWRQRGRCFARWVVCWLGGGGVRGFLLTGLGRFKQTRSIGWTQIRVWRASFWMLGWPWSTIRACPTRLLGSTNGRPC